jgi:hypothetical protein
MHRYHSAVRVAFAHRWLCLHRIDEQCVCTTRSVVFTLRYLMPLITITLLMPLGLEEQIVFNVCCSRSIASCMSWQVATLHHRLRTACTCLLERSACQELNSSKATLVGAQSFHVPVLDMMHVVEPDIPVQDMRYTTLQKHDALHRHICTEIPVAVIVIGEVSTICPF